MSHPPPSLLDTNNSTDFVDSVRSNKVSYRELNQLRIELKELQIKYDNLLRINSSSSDPTIITPTVFTAGNANLPSSSSSLASLHPASSPRSGGQQQYDYSASSLPSSASSNSTTHSASDYLHLQHSNHLLQSQATSLQSALLTQSEELVQQRQKEKESVGVISGKDGVIEEMKRELQGKQEEINQLRKEHLSSIETITTLTSTITQHESKLEEQSSRLITMDSEFKHLRQIQQEKIDLETMVEKLRSLLRTSSQDASRRYQDSQNSLHATRQYLEELKAEYETYAAHTRLESEIYKRLKGKELHDLQERFDQLKLSHYESSSDIQEEHMEIISTLQENYMEYRLMVEQIFASEAKALEGKLQEQSTKYESELRYLTAKKDMHFQQMIQSKDAKIMNLIEGTDFSKILIQHQMELSELGKKHERDLEDVRVNTQQESKKLILSLKKDIIDRQTEIEKYHTQILTWEKKLESTLGLLKKQKKLHQLKEEQYETHQRESQLQLNKSYQQIEALIQVKENLRHRILRLRLQIEGTADDSLPSLIKRLTKETKRLSTDLSLITFQYKTRNDEYTTLQNAYEKQKYHVRVMEKELKTRTEEYKKMVKTYEGFLYSRLRGAVTAKGSEDLSMTSTTKQLNNNISNEESHHAMIQAMQTILRATMKQEGLQLAIGGIGGGGGAGSSGTLDTLHEHKTTSTSSLGGEDPHTHSHASSSGNIMRRSFGMPQQHPQHQQRNSFHLIDPSASSSAASLSPFIAPRVASSIGLGNDSNAIILPAAASGFNSRAISHSYGQQQQPRHMSLTPATSGQMLMPLQQPPTATTGGVADDPARQSRLHDLIHASGNMSIPVSSPPAITSSEARKSHHSTTNPKLPSRIRDETAKILMQHDEQRDEDAAHPHQMLSGSASQQKPSNQASKLRSTSNKKKKSLIHTHRTPALLSSLSSGDLVDTTSILHLEQGFAMLSRFKQVSSEFERDAKGRNVRRRREEKVSEDGENERKERKMIQSHSSKDGGVGAFARSGGQQQHIASTSTLDEENHQHDEDGDSDEDAPTKQDDGIDVAEKATRFYSQHHDDQQHAAVDSRTSSMSFSSASIDRALQLNLHEYVDPQSQLATMHQVHHEGEASRLYRPS